MPAPAFLLPVISSVAGALRIPALAAFLGALANQVLGFLVSFFGRNIAVNLTVITMIVGLALGIIVALKALVMGISYIAPAELSRGFSLFVPGNAIPCLSVILSAKVIRWVWTWQFWTINKVTS